jgi:hypothetical protein
MNKTLFLLMVFLLSVSFVSAQDWVIVGDTVFVNDTNAFISAEPHTLTSSGDVEFTLISKSYSGDIDVLFGFNTSEARPVNAFYYTSINITETKNYTCEHNFNYTINPNYAWCYATWNYINRTTNTTVYENHIFFKHDFLNGNLTTKTIYWNETKQGGYIDVSNKFINGDFDYGGNNKWYWIKNFGVEAGKEYKLKSFIQVPKPFGGSYGKYWLAIKPSTETINESINKSHFYFLDPWWNATGGTITFDGLYTVHTYTANGTFNVTTSGSLNVTVLIVAGGGAGYGAGGGAGGLIHNTSYNATGNINIIVGSGGIGDWTTDNSLGRNSSFGTLSALGGGSLNMTTGNGTDGGSGSGGGTGGLYDIGHGLAGQGYDGGQGSSAGWLPGGGGGGAGGVGETAPDGYNAGDGGPGITYTINGSSVCYAGGGGAGFHYENEGTPGSATCGGGAGTTILTTGGINGTNGLGGGGGGGPYQDAATTSNGGSGIVIVRYLTPTANIGINIRNIIINLRNAIIRI